MINKKVAILWSGGVDSTSVLKQYLEATNFRILVIHLNYVTPNQDERYIYEMEAVNRMLPKLKEIRDFEYTTLNLGFEKDIFSGDLILFAASVFVLAASQGCKEIIIGFVSDIRKNQSFYVKNKLFAMNSLCEVIAKFDNYKRIPRFKKPIKGIYGSKSYYIEKLGEVFPLTHWCRNPTEIKQGEHGCGHCMPCKHITRILEIKAKIVSE